MSEIRILSPKLVSQIAAGEVVERPSSVVKELIENSLDAGANSIDIEIDHGGVTRIRVHDNGIGISKKDLSLALERHATSKINTLEDLTKIKSLGFRGEALSSISSVSRLILTSRVDGQIEGWQVYAEGHEMSFTLKPIAHPIGTTVEVFDLFYNTPVRRKFLRTEKTEFNHIDEIIRRIALSRFDVKINLSHNSKLVRQYRSINTKNNIKNEEQYKRRLAIICGDNFTRNSLTLYWVKDDLEIKGWIIRPNLDNNSKFQYYYVNGRIIRDRIINHAIRQAYADVLQEEQNLAYVLYLNIDPNNIDVNVHPTKLEIRFHQSRLVHDFIYQGLINALKKQKNLQQCCQQYDQLIINKTQKINSIVGLQQNSVVKEKLFKSYNVDDCLFIKNNTIGTMSKFNKSNINSLSETDSLYYPNKVEVDNVIFSRERVEFDQKLLNNISERENKNIAISSFSIKQNYTFSKILTIYLKKFALIESYFGIGLLSLIEAKKYLKINQLIPADINKGLKIQPLLMPVKLILEDWEIDTFYRVKILLNKLGFDVNIFDSEIIIHGVSCPLRSQNMVIFFPKLLKYLSQNIFCQLYDLIIWIADQIINKEQVWTITNAMHLLIDFELIYPELIKKPPKKLIQIIDFQSTIAALTNE
ncbi:DNA mismatch repair endonuclease MutL [Arsenophonus endosymbiont of Lipoptena cervi]|uniref:DNA mismatch repair endonuclease MutL n=1 Tax=Arsenophonus endosymbiont of Lipoptena cervi TaxID=363258 RepID=UPI00376EFB02